MKLEQNLKKSYRSLLKKNQRTNGKFRYTVPSSSSKRYPNQWLWDSCFHALIYLQLDDPEYAKDELRALLSAQWENGLVPHVIYWNGHHDKLDWGTKKDTSSLTQPPMIAYAVEKIYNYTKDKEFVHEVFNKLDRYYTWLRDERGSQNLINIVHPWESGLDDFGSWDSVYHITNPTREALLVKKHFLLKKYVEYNLNTQRFMKDKIFNVQSVLFNIVYLKNLYSMEHLAKIIDSPRIRYYHERIPKVRRAFKKNHLHRKTGLYAALYNKYTFVDSIENASIFLPLYAGVLTKQEANDLVKKYLMNKKKFWANYPISTLPMDSEIFEPDRYWRGSTWININWFVYKGLTTYGYHREAEKIKKRSFELVTTAGWHEYFNPLTGKGHGPNDFCWSGLIFAMN